MIGFGNPEAADALWSSLNSVASLAKAAYSHTAAQPRQLQM
jgi:hypothetical protein